MEKVNSTKDRIISESLRLFSEKGYDGVSMREIAAAVGIKGASLYNHFKGKEDIFNAIFEEMKAQYSNAALLMGVPNEESNETVSFYMGAQQDQLLIMAEQLFGFFAKNEFVSMFRRLLVAEQFRSLPAAEYYRQYYLEAPVKFQSTIFAGMQKHGYMTGYDPESVAIHFYSPLLYTLAEYDLGKEYEMCLESLKKHVINFCKVYGTLKQ